MSNLLPSAFTVDVEDGISIAMRDAFGKSVPQTARVRSNTEMVLELLKNKRVKGTFFVLGQVARDFPDVVKSISDNGHELGVHGYDHWQFFKMDRNQAFEEISSAKKLIEDISGKQVFGHRAPAFSITPKSRWGLDIIAESGFKYDSSIMPCGGKRYGWPGFPKEIINLKMENERCLVEVPLSTDTIFTKEFPVCGGGYLRLFPKSLTHRSFKRISKKRPVIIYMHPYEVDNERYPEYYHRALRQTNLKTKLRVRSFWVNRRSVFTKLESLLDSYRFDTLYNIISKSEIETRQVSEF